jgi:general secretion pathway protein I
VTRFARKRGFSLIEVMIAVTILAAALTWIVVGMARNIQAENHAKLMSTASFLARYKMNDVEDDLYTKGFSDFEKDQVGTFEERGFERFAWKVVIDKVEMPSSDQVQTMMGKANDAKNAITGADPSQQQQQQNADPSQSPIGQGMAAMSSLYPVIKQVLEDGIRRMTVQVLWYEGRSQYDVSIVAYYTDPSKVDVAAASVASGSLGASGAAATATGTGASGASATPASSAPATGTGH